MPFNLSPSRGFDTSARARFTNKACRINMYRDMAALSLPLTVIAPLGLFIADASLKAMWVGAVMFVVQYVLTAVSARNAGERFVCNVLAVHSTKKVVTPRTTTMSKSPSLGGSTTSPRGSVGEQLLNTVDPTGRFNPQIHVG